MTLKSFKEFIYEDFRSSQFGKGKINDIDVDFYHEKLDTINLKEYINTFFKNRRVSMFLSSPLYGTPDFLRFLLFYCRGSFHIFVFNGRVSHNNFIKMLDDTEYNYTPIENYKELYRDCLREYYNKDEEQEKLEELENIWCFPGMYDSEIKSLSASKYLDLLAKLDIHKKLGFDENTWKSIYY
jgi:hypothetical protein